MKKFFILASIILIAACTMPMEQRPMPRLTYTQYPVTNINVGSIQIVEKYAMPMQNPNIEHLMPQPLPQAVADWARKRFKATGSAGTMVITINQASVVRQDLPKTDGVKGWFTVDQSERYDARVSVEFRVDGTGHESGSGVVNLTRGQTIAENTSIEERDRIWTHMEEVLLTDLDASTQKTLQEKIGFALR